jgi:hypothetical protein
MSPSARFEHAMAWDAPRRRLVLFGGLPPLLGDTWLHGNLVAAGAQTIGSACAGTNGPPTILSTAPFLGNGTFVLDLLSGRSSAPCLFMLANRTQSLSLGGGCTLYLSGFVLPFPSATNASGFSSVSLSIPTDHSLHGAAAHAQALVNDPMGAFAGVAMSAGLKLLFGD